MEIFWTMDIKRKKDSICLNFRKCTEKPSYNWQKEIFVRQTIRERGVLLPIVENFRPSDLVVVFKQDEDAFELEISGKSQHRISGPN